MQRGIVLCLILFLIVGCEREKLLDGKSDTPEKCVAYIQKYAQERNLEKMVEYMIPAVRNSILNLHKMQIAMKKLQVSMIQKYGLEAEKYFVVKGDLESVYDAEIEILKMHKEKDRAKAKIRTTKNSRSAVEYMHFVKIDGQWKVWPGKEKPVDEKYIKNIELKNQIMIQLIPVLEEMILDVKANKYKTAKQVNLFWQKKRIEVERKVLQTFFTFSGKKFSKTKK